MRQTLRGFTAAALLLLFSMTSSEAASTVPFRLKLPQANLVVLEASNGGGTGGSPSPGRPDPGAPSTPGGSGPAPAPTPIDPDAVPDIGGLTVLRADVGESVTGSVSFKNTTGHDMLLHYYPNQALAFPFTASKGQDCPALGGVLASGAVCTVYVTFAPTKGATGTYVDDTNLKFNWQFAACASGPCTDPLASGHETAPIPVRGEVWTPEGPVNLAMTGPTDLGTLAVGSYTAQVTVKNRGGNFFQLYHLGVEGDFQGQATLTSHTCGGGLGRGASCTVTYGVTVSQWQPSRRFEGRVRILGADASSGLYNLEMNHPVVFTKAP